MVRLGVQVAFGSAVSKGTVAQELEVDAAPGDSVLQLKEKVAAAAGGAVTADDLLISFGAPPCFAAWSKGQLVDSCSLRLHAFLLALHARSLHGLTHQLSASPAPPRLPPPPNDRRAQRPQEWAAVPAGPHRG